MNRIFTEDMASGQKINSTLEICNVFKMKDNSPLGDS